MPIETILFAKRSLLMFRRLSSVFTVIWNQYRLLIDLNRRGFRFLSSLTTRQTVRIPLALGASMTTKKMTRASITEKEMESFKKMTREEKRKLYKCGSNYVTLEDVKTWPEYYKTLSSKQKFKAAEAKFEVNDKLNSKVSIWRGDITKLESDAIVNAANNSLLGGGGVDGAIHSAAGTLLYAECKTLDGCETGNAKITLGYKLPAKHVIHTVGPIGEHPDKLRSCYDTCLKIVQEEKLTSVAFPCISTGIYGYPNRNAAEIALTSTRRWLEKNADNTERVIFCLFLPVDVAIYEELMQVYFPLSTPEDSKDQQAEESTKAEAKEEDGKGDNEVKASATEEAEPTTVTVNSADEKGEQPTSPDSTTESKDAPKADSKESEFQNASPEKVIAQL